MRTTRTADDPPFTEEEVNDILNRVHQWKKYTGDKNPINVFKLHGVLFLGNSEDGEWNLNKNYMMYSEHTCNVTIDQFAWCETEEDVKQEYSKGSITEIIDRLL